jgi:hypothetical protein
LRAPSPLEGTAVVYVDTLRDWGWRLGPSCHLAADTLAELHAFAARLGMRRSWFQPGRGRPHYDLTASRRAVAVRLGAVELAAPAIIPVMRRCAGTG